MAYSYLVLKKFVQELDELLKGSRITTIFSHQKNGIAIGLQIPSNDELSLIGELVPGKELLIIRKNFSLPKRNKAELFTQFWGEKIESIQIENLERAFRLATSKNQSLLFSVFGNHPNVTTWDGQELTGSFKGKTGIGDSSIELEKISISTEIKDSNELKQSFPVIDKWTEKHFYSQGFYEMELTEQQNFLNKVLAGELKNSHIFISKTSPPFLTLFDFPDWEDLGDNAISAFREFEFRTRNYYEFTLSKEKHLKALEKEFKRVKARINRLEKEIEEKKGKNPFMEKADLLMANLHLFQNGKNEAEVENFFSGKKEVIKIKENLSPQKQAEKWYTKSKSREKEIQESERQLESAKNQHLEISSSIARIEESKGIKDLREEIKESSSQKSKKNQSSNSLPYKEIQFMGYEIRVGKSGEKNDQLLSGFSRKNDIWFHVRDSPGSHVILVKKDLEPIPNEVIEKAAGLAIYHSKRKNEMNCPVIKTERKYVRKIKGAPPGLVRVEKEEVVFANPVEE